MLFILNEMDKSLILNTIKEHYKFKTTTSFAKFLGIKQNTLSNWYARNTIDYDRVISKCDGINGHWLLTGKGDPFCYENVKQEKNITTQEKPLSEDMKGDFETLIVKMILESDKFKKGVVQILSEEAEDINEKKKKYLEELGDFWEKLQRDKSIKVSNKTAN